jgi:hypothetical protein
MGFVEAIHRIATARHPDLSEGIALIYDANEASDAISHIHVALRLAWSVYLYPESATATMYFWEGDLIDIWSTSQPVFDEAGRLLSQTNRQ